MSSTTGPQDTGPQDAGPQDFASLGLSPGALATVRRAGFRAPTPIQAQAIPPVLAGRDVIGCAATGTGKTAAYLLPLVERLVGGQGTRALVLAPTRELAQQVGEQARLFGEDRGVTSAVVIGGEDMAAQARALAEAPALVVATPGRLVDLLDAGLVDVRQVRSVVLDEADRMLDMGFLPQLERVLAALRPQHQTLLFSATLGAEVARFARARLHRPVRVEVTPSGTPAPRAEQRLYWVKTEEKQPLLLTLLAREGLAREGLAREGLAREGLAREGRAREAGSALVFTRTRQRADKVLAALQRAGHVAMVLHAERTQAQRREALEAFRTGQVRVLVATDVAARGLDVTDVGHVISYDLPHEPADYVHRVGRTARAGASGRASTFATVAEGREVREVERVMRARIPRAELPHEDPLFREALEAFRARQREPGPPQPGHRQPAQTEGQAPGRHARTHAPRKGKGPPPRGDG